MKAYSKAVAAAIATIVMFLVFDQGSVETVELAITTIVTTFLVYLVPNRA